MRYPLFVIPVSYFNDSMHVKFKLCVCVCVCVQACPCVCIQAHTFIEQRHVVRLVAQDLLASWEDSGVTQPLIG